ncbi:glycosyltransferase family 4 protein [Sandaracinobacteroides saxicola]|uniref:Undecaprenyl/decaprenyl-phosphate alpha-N-acetylglucosaminyl 1-phosphate transferase n=1 Tax=Sandaracinobacteroides saxicola TaxID=2759707 RepID=A0A7G5IKS2_9SPHN|nr:MraY family glycosyltransferase [Sandaracinobacteroides saxicola]QMW23964.1 undecaprenyl/decaprenyl-phosphate alpha-N-acetylglucosaminyl 1-phosphate transferase [Sandaracinobacteroides saxicola]
MTTTALLLGLLGAAVASGVGWWAKPLGMRLSLLDFPDLAGGRKLHAEPTPLVGGIALMLTMLLAVGWMLFAGPDIGASLRVHMLWFLLTVGVMFLIGLADDRFGLTALLRLALATAILLFGAAEVFEFQVSFLRFAGDAELIPLPGLWGLGFTLLCLIGFLNAVNMADGKNGLVIGQALIWALVLAARLPAELLPVLAALAGTLLVLFLFNMRGRLFLGDSGSYCLSAIFGLLAVFGWNNGFADMNADDVALIFALPVFDTLRLIVQRVAQGRSPFSPGRDHLHHYLFDRWGWPGPLPWVLALVALPNMAALIWPGTGLWWLGVTLLGYVGLMWAARRGRVAAAI